MRLIELFSGIGSFRTALESLDVPAEAVAVSEVDRHALASYKAIHGDCPNLGDVRGIRELPPCDVLTYSFPCQDLSIAGRMAGMEEGSGTRSALVWETVRLLESCDHKPEWLMMENVPQVVKHLRPLVSRLEALGYRSRWAVLDSSLFGSAQKRKRCIMVSRLDAEVPDLPLCDPSAARPVLKDVMETEVDDKFIRRVPLENIRWRETKQSGTVRIADDTAYSYDMERRIYSSSGLAPSVVNGHGVRTKVLADWERPGKFEMSNRIYSQDALSPTLICHGGGGHAVMTAAEDTTKKYRCQGRILDKNGLSPTLRAQCRGLANHPRTAERVSGGFLEVRILTPKECWRLMGQSDAAYERAAAVCSETQLYNQAGNAIVIQVLQAVFRRMLGA